jgi:hypothetical protein
MVSLGGAQEAKVGLAGQGLGESRTRLWTRKTHDFTHDEGVLR